jgi:ribonucleoside-triphosphate reductase
LGQLVNFFYTLQGEVAGAVAVANFDTYLAPFIALDKLTYDETKQAMQEFIYNMNVPTRVGFQSPFTNVTLDLVPPKTVGEEAVIIGGQPIKAQYKDFQKEIDLFNKVFAEVMLEGDAQGRVFTFPIPTYSVTKDFDWDNPKLQPVWEMTRKYGIPYWANYVNSDMSPEDSRSMCCRLKLDNRVLRKRGGLFSANPLTGSIGVVTINMPRVGYLSKNRREFFSRLGRLMDLAKESLEIKRRAVEEFTVRGLYPYCRYYLSDVHARFNEYWKNHFNTIGLLGMNEACLNFLKTNIVSDQGKQFTLEVMNFMKQKLLIYQEETGNLYNLEATPGEGTSYRFAKLDKQYYPDIIVANEDVIHKNGFAPYYTNSTQLPVGATDDIFEALTMQDELQANYTGGTVLHGFLGEAPSSVRLVKDLVKKIANNFRLPYFTLTPTFSICPKHGYLTGEHEYCPKCDEILGISK